MNKNNLRITIVIAALVIVVSGIYFLTSSNPKSDTVKKSPSCGCCNGYIAALESDGFQVKSVNMDDLTAIKNKYNIPTEMQSCHTTIIGRYFIEGHVPLDAVKKLLQEQPDIDGIALPGMPIGTPGMPGPKESPFVIYQIKDGQSSEFMKI